MACSHEGDTNLAKQIIQAAGKAGADAIQFQIWSLSDYMSHTHPDYSKLERIELSAQHWKDLATFSKQHFPRMEIIACVSEEKSIALCETLPVSAFKIHAGDIENIQLLQHARKSGKRIDLSIGACTIQEIERAIAALGYDTQVWLMYGMQRFPTPIDEVHLRHLVELARYFGKAVGYQDHTDGGDPAGFWIPAAAIGMGITIQEKHLTHDRSKKGIDHEAALDPAEFSEFVRMVRTLELAMGEPGIREFSSSQLAYRKYARKSLVAKKDLQPGDEISEQNIAAMRVEEPGLSPVDLSELVGQKLKTAVLKGHRLTPEALK